MGRRGLVHPAPPHPPPRPPVRQLRSFFSLYYLNEQIKDLGDHSVSLRLSRHSLVHSIHSLDMPGMAWRDGGDLVAEPSTTGATCFWQVDQPPAWLSRCKRQLQWARHSRFLSNPGKHPIFSLLSGCPVTPRCAQPPVELPGPSCGSLSSGPEMAGLVNSPGKLRSLSTPRAS